MSVAIVDYGSGNLRSAAKAFERVARESDYHGRITVTSEPSQVLAADRIVLPGVGAFADCKRGLDGVPGMADALEEAVIGDGKPFLGICVGMQLMAESGHEHEVTTGLGWIKGRVERMQPNDPSLKIPHMGWNQLAILRAHPLFAGLGSGDHVYFVHSYQLNLRDPDDCLATSEHGGTVAAAVGRDNLVGTQFHPEKSQAAGLRFIGNFLRWRP
ncbi:MAG: imidazole glycerol phosphate synthase subunit HisH [Proteobacteria bacterium]|nr:imidazole glycerol phosphate synthase subunit HisH [Pseudomonadota bacterium]